MDKCLNCENSFPRKYRSKGVRKLYCCRTCTWEAYKKVKYEKICKTCGIYFQAGYNKKDKEYCSLGCIERHPCQLCGKIITGRVFFQGGLKKFCSTNCSNFFHKTMKSKFQYMPKGFAKSIQNHGKIICNQCGNSDTDILCVHHKNGDRKDNSYDNLETLCPNCHYKIHWNESKNRVRYIKMAYLLQKYDSL